MDIIALQRYVRVSPKKMRVVADVAKKMSPLEAVEKLPFLRKRGAEVVLKVIKSALASAKQKGLSDDTLLFKEIQIGEGPRLKRGRAASRGRWHPYKKRMSHVRVVLAVKEAKKNVSDTKDLKDGVEKETGSKTEAVKDGLKGKDLHEGLIIEEKPVKSVGNALKGLISKRMKVDEDIKKKGEVK